MAAVVRLLEVKAFTANPPALPAKVTLTSVRTVGGASVTTVRLYDVRAVGGAVPRKAQVRLYDVRAIGGEAGTEFVLMGGSWLPLRTRTTW